MALLLAAGATVDQALSFGMTPVFVASGRGHLACVQLLSSYGAARSVTNQFQVMRSAEEWATRKGQPHITAWLSATSRWITPLHHLEIIDSCRARALL